MRQVIALMRRAGRRLGIVGRKRGRHTAAYLAEVPRQRQASPAAPQRARHVAPPAPSVVRQAAPSGFGAREALRTLRREAPPMAPDGPSRQRTTRGARLRVMTHGIRLDQVFTAALPVVPQDPPDVALLRRVLVGLHSL
ncbi:hypothetical protein ACIOWI_36710 [Streptomyces sp. NPDC087659]|uniref:hypothetical protein n=1 Tax=Streptomyces sp. NPDC087659 TaxID=3365801 RepID=UPI003812B38F